MTRVARAHDFDDGDLPIDNNWAEHQIRPIALGRQTWLFAGSLRSGKHSAGYTSLIRAAQINGLEPYANLREVLDHLPLHPASHIDSLMPHP